MLFRGSAGMIIYTPESQQQIWDFFLNKNPEDELFYSNEDLLFDPYLVFENCIDFLAKISGYKYKKIVETLNQFYMLLENGQVRIVETEEKSFHIEVIAGDSNYLVQWVLAVPNHLTNNFALDPIGTIYSILEICTILVCILNKYSPSVQKRIVSDSSEMFFPTMKAFTLQQILLDYVESQFGVDVTKKRLELKDIQNTIGAQYN